MLTAYPIHQSQITSIKKLMTSAKTGDVETITQLIDAGLDVNVRNESGSTALHYAADKNQFAAAVALVKLGGKLSEYDGSLWTPLHYAVDGGHEAMVELLVRQGADTVKPGKCAGGPLDNPPTNLGITPLHMATVKSNTILKNVLNGFQKTGIDINEVRDKWGGRTPLHIAIENTKNISNIKLLLAAGANPLVKGNNDFVSPALYHYVGSSLEIANEMGATAILALFESALHDKINTPTYRPC